MAVSARKQLQFWGIGFALLCLVLWLLGSTLLPFLLGAGMAYFLDPLADRLERLGMNRVAATSVIAISGILALAAALIFAVPALIGQIQALVAATPDYIANLAAFLGRRYPELFGEHSRLMRSLTDVETMMREGGMTVANTVLVGALGVVQVLLLLVVSPVVAFYLLLDWDRMIANVNAMLPREHALTIRGLARDIDTVLAGFVRGQLTVCLILGTFYAVALMAIGLQYGFLVGMIAGMLSFIPYVGSATGLVLSVGIAAIQFWGQPVWIVVDRRHLPVRPVRRGQRAGAEPDRQVGRAASGLAAAGAVGVRRAVRLRRAARRGAGRGGARGDRAVPDRPVHGEPALHRAGAAAARGVAAWPWRVSSCSTCRCGRRSGAPTSWWRRRTRWRWRGSTAGPTGRCGGSP